MSQSPDIPAEERKTLEKRMFLFIITIFFPLLSIALVGGYGLIIWVSQLIFGPPSI